MLDPFPDTLNTVSQGTKNQADIEFTVRYKMETNITSQERL